MNILEKFKLEWQLMMKMRKCYIEGNDIGLNFVKEEAFTFYVDCGKTYEEAVRLTENLFENAYFFAFDEE